MIFCQACGTTNREGSRFCNQCGARLSETADIACPRCGAPNAPDWQHCQKCGLDLARGRDDVWEGPLPRVDVPEEGASEAGRPALGTPEGGPARRARPHGLPPWLDSAERPEEEAFPESSTGPLPVDEEALAPEAAEGEWSGEAIPIEPVVGVPYRARERAEQPPPPEQREAADLFAMMSDEDVLASRRPSASEGSHEAERRPEMWLRLLVALVLLVSTMVTVLMQGGPISAEGSIPPPVAAAARAIEQLPPGATALVAFEYDAGLAGDLQPVAEALISEMLGRGLYVLAVSTQPEGAALAEIALDRVRRARAEPGADARAVNLGYVTGGQAAIRALAEDIRTVIPSDWEGRELADIPALSGIGGAGDLPLVVVLGRDVLAVQAWIEQVGAPYGAPLVAGVPALVEPALVPYQTSGQLQGVVGGAAGAAAFERLTGRPGVGVRSLGAVRAGAWAAGLLIVTVNIGFALG
ncbi:MAG: zinc ribbon domain-containing protein, partial [Anaerolineae bacterium]|nr:zinc ribbon domain-containing protein [Anaerolineae bacterium]